MKSEVFLLGEQLDVPRSILSATPTDGLWEDNRTDEDQIGASYDELEWAMSLDKDIDPNNLRVDRKKFLEFITI